MAIRNHRPDLNGLLIIDKPLGWTSADVCRFVRRRSGGAKVGHAGTLDPLATGVLIVCLGKATKMIDGLMAIEKTYRAEVDLSAFSATDDAEGERQFVDVDSLPALGAIRAACDALTGRIMQRPPNFSAVKVGGQRAYRMARRGDTPEIKPKPVEVHAIEILEYAWPRLTLDIRCGKGTYIRSIARDLGASLGTGGMLSGLVRTSSGAFTIEDAVAPEELPERIDPQDLLSLPAGGGS